MSCKTAGLVLCRSLARPIPSQETIQPLQNLGSLLLLLTTSDHITVHRIFHDAAVNTSHTTCHTTMRAFLNLPSRITNTLPSIILPKEFIMSCPTYPTLPYQAGSSGQAATGPMGAPLPTLMCCCSHPCCPCDATCISSWWGWLLAPLSALHMPTPCTLLPAAT
jgi:hypothetical protein